MQMITWEEICELEPRVKPLLYAARHIRDNKGERSFCANYVFMNVFKPMIVDLVGIGRPHKKRMLREDLKDSPFKDFFVYSDIEDDARLATSYAYDIVYDKIYESLPNCRNCCCW